MAYHPLKIIPVFCFTLFICLTGCDAPAPPGQTTQSVDLNGRQFTLELALDDDARFQGLSDRSEIAPDGGMLFVFPDSDIRTFVMRRCPVPIDIVFLGANGRVVAMHAMQVEPHPTREASLKHYSSQYPAQFAIELAGGTLQTLQIDLGQPLKLPMKALKARAR